MTICRKPVCRANISSKPEFAFTSPVIVADTYSISHKLIVICIICLLVFETSQVGAIQIGYNLKVGKTYKFAVTKKIISETNAFELKNVAPSESKSEITVKVLAFRDGIWVLDIHDGDNHTRRYLRQNGAIVSTPGEFGNPTPFVFSFPPGDCEQGKMYRSQMLLQIGNGQFPAKWDLILTGVNTTDKKAAFQISGAVAFPWDKVIQRTLTASGTYKFDLEAGCPESGDWVVSYLLNYGLKENALEKELWNFKETRNISFRLIGVEP